MRKTYEAEGAPVRALRGVDMTMTRRVRGHHGSVRMWQVHLVEPRRRSRRADEGRYSWRAKVTGRSEDDLARMRRRHIGIVFQFFNLLEGMSVLENVTLPAVIAGPGRKKAESRARDLLDLLGLADKARRRPVSFRAGSVSAWPSPAPWRTARPCCWPTSRPGRSTPRVVRRSSSCSAGSMPGARRSSSSPTTTASPRLPSGSSGCGTGASHEPGRRFAAEATGPSWSRHR